MSTDRELLELAAKAAEIQIQWHRCPSTARETAYVPNGDFSEQHDVCYSPWNPLTDDGDALRLAVKLGLWVHIGKYDVAIEGTSIEESCVKYPYAATRRAIVRAATRRAIVRAATRRAIVRAAAEIGRQMQEGGEK